MLLILLSPLFLAALSTASTSKSSSKCVDGVHNRLRMHDMFKGQKDVVFEDFVMLTYDNRKRPSCTTSGVGKVVLPGYYKFMSGKIRVKKQGSIVGAAHLHFNLEKNSMFVGTVCLNGKSANAFVGDELCNVDLFSLASPAAFKQFQRVGVTDIMDLPGDWGEMKPMIRQDNPYIEGEWKVSVALAMAGSSFAGVTIGDGWIEVATVDHHAEF
ncbi:dct-18 [Pristionchus pacificus]|uniref:Dct-18 n=1 Tax=Pristionchus pacificus TaxID=54126 RepID=A0A454XM77_PRIPA|nr:dct-18 [Pristionchus pacificus]|eukprot:PDM82362.1 dct-18 [Pristionchus pacificus]